MNNFKDVYFPRLNDFEHNNIFKNIEQVWDPLKILENLIDRILVENNPDNSLEALPGIKTDLSNANGGIFIERWIKLQTSITSKALGIRIGSGTILEPTTIIKGPAIIGKNNDIRQGAYLRGNIIVGNDCVIGHCTEIKNSILMNHVEAGHFNYIGDSILGNYINMGAGSRLANVQFRSLQEKMENFIKTIEIPTNSGTTSTQMSKFGSIIGDNSEIGCNAVLCPGTLIGKDTWIYPNCTVPKGFYPPGYFIAPKDHKPKSRPK